MNDEALYDMPLAELEALIDGLAAEAEHEKASGVRCSGHCCRSFTITTTIERLKECAEYVEAVKRGDVSVPRPDVLLTPTEDLLMVSRMLESLGTHDRNPEFPHEPVERAQPFYRCKNLTGSGDCAIYDRRPKMCSDYAAMFVCQYSVCTGPSRKGGPLARHMDAVRVLNARSAVAGTLDMGVTR